MRKLTYANFFRLRKELYRNALSSKSPFGGGNHGHLGACMGALTYSIETGGVNWTVPDSAGMFPLFPAGATDDRKKQIIAEFVRDETGINFTDATVQGSTWNLIPTWNPIQVGYSTYLLYQRLDRKISKQHGASSQQPTANQSNTNQQLN